MGKYIKSTQCTIEEITQIDLLELLELSHSIDILVVQIEVKHYFEYCWLQIKVDYRVFEEFNYIYSNFLIIKTQKYWSTSKSFFYHFHLASVYTKNTMNVMISNELSLHLICIIHLPFCPLSYTFSNEYG